MKKKILLVTLMALICSFGALATACGETPSSSTGSETNSGAQQQKEERYSLTYLSYELEINEDFTLGFDDGTLVSEVTWSSSDETVATVDENGKVVAKKAGVAVIKAENDAFFSSCNVTVTDNGILPTLTLNVQGGNTAFTQGNTYDIVTAFAYNQKTYTDVTYTYASSDSAVVTVDENGVMTAVRAGTATVSVTATWRNASPVVESFNVEVLDDAFISVNKQTVQMYSTNPTGMHFATSDTIALQFFDGDVEKTVEWTAVEELAVGAEAGEVATYANGVFTAVAKGTTQFKFTCEYEGILYESDIVTVEVLTPVVKMNKELLMSYDSTAGATVNLDGIGISYTALTAITEQNGNQIPVDGSLKIPANQIQTGAYTWHLYFDEVDVAYEVQAIVADKIIYNLDDFNAISATGYYVLGSDLDLSGLAYTKFLMLSDGSQYNWYAGGDAVDGKFANEGFNGTLDGRGYTIKNINAISYGIFAIVGQNGVIKNVGFEKFSGGSTLQTVLSAQFYGTLENVSFYSANPIWSPIAIAYGAKFINVVSYLPNSTGCSLYQQLVINERTAFENVYLVSNKGLGAAHFGASVDGFTGLHTYSALTDEELRKVNFEETFAISEESLWSWNAAVELPFVTKDKSVSSICKVTFTDGTNTLAVVNVTPGQVVAEIPSAGAGYTYSWTKDGEAFDLTAPITESVTLVGTKVFKQILPSSNSYIQANGGYANAIVTYNEEIAGETAAMKMYYNPNSYVEVYAQWKFDVTAEDIAVYKDFGYTKITFKVYAHSPSNIAKVNIYGKEEASFTNGTWKEIVLDLDTLAQHIDNTFWVYLSAHSYGFTVAMTAPVLS